MILDFFPENALGDGPKNSRIRVKTIFLEKAKYEQLPKKDLDRLNEYVELPERGLQVRCNVSDYALAEIWWKV